MGKKILCILIVFVLVCGSPIASFRVRAAALPIAPTIGGDVSIEILQILLGLLASGLVVSGAELDADNIGAAFDELWNSISSDATTVPLYSSGFYFTENDESHYISLEDAVAQIGTLTEDPDIDTDEEMAPGVLGEMGMTLTEYYAMLYDEFHVGDGGQEPEETPPPEEEKQYYYVDASVFDEDFMSFIANWIKKMHDGDLKALNPVDYYVSTTEYNDFMFTTEYSFNGTFPLSEDGNYTYTIELVLLYTNGNMGKFVLAPTTVVETTNKYPFVGYFSSTGLFNVVSYNPGTATYSRYNNFNNGTYYSYNSTAGTVTESSWSSNFSIYNTNTAIISMTANIPIFETQQLAEYYLKHGVEYEPGIMNWASLYTQQLVDVGVLSVLNTFANVVVEPSAFPHLYTALAAAVEPYANPEIDPETDPLDNTNALISTVTSVAADVATDAETDPEADPDAAPETNPELDPTDIEIVNKYKFDLTQVFPFCLPFDLIRFLEALAAEPEAPRFEIPFVVPALGIDLTYVIDLSFMDEVMEIVRFCELVGFCFALVMLTPKMIKW